MYHCNWMKVLYLLLILKLIQLSYFFKDRIIRGIPVLHFFFVLVFISFFLIKYIYSIRCKLHMLYIYNIVSGEYDEFVMLYFPYSQQNHVQFTARIVIYIIYIYIKRHLS